MQQQQKQKLELLPVNSPLRRSMLNSNGFPETLPLDPLLTEHGGCLHVPGMGCPRSNRKLVRKLAEEIDGIKGALQKHRSGRHLQAWGDEVMGSRVFTAVVARLLTMFGMELVDAWVNVYRNGSETKAFHHDNYKDRQPRPTVTIGLSLGDARSLAFEHVPSGPPSYGQASGRQFLVPQRNGDVFAFDEAFNQYFRHSVPAASNDDDDGVRVSIILWAKEGKGDRLAVPQMIRYGPAFGKGQEVRWDRWDLEGGLWCDTDVFG